MNKIFKVIWHHATQSWVAVSELTNVKGKSASSIDERKSLNSMLTTLAATSAIFFIIPPANATEISAGGVSSATCVYSTTNGNNLACGDVTTKAGGGQGNAGQQPNIAIGHSAIAQSVKHYVGANTKAGNIAIGYDVKAIGNGSLAIGISTGNYGGSKTVAAGPDSYAIGNGARTGGDESVSPENSITDTTKTPALGGIAIGSEAWVQTQGHYGIAIGDNAKVQRSNGSAYGRKTLSNGNGATAIGAFSEATNESAIAIGGVSRSEDAAKASGNSSIAIGKKSSAKTESSVALGAESTVLSDHGIAIGYKSNAVGGETSNIAIGQESSTNASGAIALGQKASAKGFKDLTTTGTTDKALPYNAIAIGTGASVDTIKATGAAKQERSTDAIAIGTAAKANYASTIAIGFGAEANKKSSATAIGLQSKAEGWKSLAVGAKATATQTDSVALGSDSLADVGFNIDGVDPLGAKDPATHTSVWRSTKAAVSVGDAKNADPNKRVTRQITSVAAGKEDTDAVNVAQLKAAGFVLKTAEEGGKATNSTLAGATGTADNKITNGESLTLKAGKGITLNQNGSQVTITTDLSTDKTHYYSINTTDKQEQSNFNNDGAKALDSLAAGIRVKTTSINSVAIGSDVTADGTESLAIGNKVNAIGLGATSIGNNSKAEAEGAQAFGQSSEATAQNAAAIGRYARAKAKRASAFGVGNLASGESSFAGGDRSVASGDVSIAIGLEAKSTHGNTIAIGSKAVAQIEDSIAIGRGVTTEILPADNTLPNNGVGDREGMIAIGSETTKASGKAAVSIGRNAQGVGRGTVALGDASQALEGQGVAVGAQANVVRGAAGGIAIGSLAKSEKHVAIAIGSESIAKVSHGVALGAKSVADVAANQVGSDPLSVATDKNNTTWTSTHAAVSVGNGTTVTRQITSVAAGTQDTDAVNVAQLKAAGFKLAASESEGGEHTTVADDKIQNGETVTVDAGKNIKVTHTANKVSIATKDDVKFTSVTTGDTVMKNDGITIKAPSNQPGPNPTTDVKLTANGLDNGGNSIANVKGNLPETTNGDKNANPVVPATTTQQLPDNVNAIKNNAATVGDILNAGFNLQTNDTALDFVKAYDTLNFKNGVNTKVRATTDGTTNNLFVDVVGLPIQYTTADGRPVAKVGDEYYALDENGVPCFKCTKPEDFVASVINPKDSGPKTRGSATKLANVQGNLQQVTADGQVNNPNGTKAKDPSVENLKAGPQTADEIKTLRDTPKSANYAATLGDVLNSGWNLQGNGAAKDFVRHADTVNFVDGTGTTVEVETTEDGTTSKVKVNTLVELVDTEGNPVKKAKDGKFYKASEIDASGNPTAGATEVDKPQVNLVNPTAAADQQTKSLIQLGNVDKGTKDTDGVNVSQLKGAITALGGGATLNDDGSVKAPTYNITNPADNNVTTVNSVGDALTKLSEVVNNPLTFVGDNTTEKVTRKLGTQLQVKGGKTTDLTDNNIGVVGNAADNSLTVKLAKDINLGKTGSLTTGNTVVNNGGVTIQAPAGGTTTNVTLTAAGLDNGGNKVVNVADGNVAADSKDAVNGSQLHAVKTNAEGKLGSFTVGADKAATAAGIVVNKDNARFDIVGADSGKVTTAVEGNKVTVDLTQEAKDSLAKADSALQNVVSNDPNLIATKNGDTITLDFSDTPTFKGVTAGEGENQVVLDNKGVNVGGNTYISNAGLNANNKAVMNVASNLPVTNDNTATAGQPNNGTTAQTKPANVDAIKNNAATVADVLNAGFNLQTNGTATDFVKPYDTVNFADGTGTTVTSETDGNKTTFKVNVDAQKLAETAQLPVVYTKADGTKVYKHADGNFYTDPTDKTNKVEPAEIIASMQGADGSTTDPTTLANVQAGKKDTDAVNVSQLKGAVDALGGGAGFNADGSVKAPIYNLTDPTTGTASTVNNVGDALTYLNTAVNKPLTFVGDVGTFDRKLGQTTTVKGGVISEAELSNSNIGVVAKDGTLEIKLAKDVNVDSVVAGGTKIDSNGLTFINANGLPVDNSPSISKTGINAGNQKITSVAKGTDDTDAVNVAQLKEVDAKAGVKTKVTAGEGVDVTNKGTADAPNYEVALNQQTKDSLNKADSAVQSIVIKAEGSQVKELTKDNNELNIKGDTNISVTNDNGEVKVALNKDVTGLDSLTSKKVTAGEGPNQVVLDNKGVNVGGKTYISDAGLNANDKKITNVADGAVTVDSKDAVNGSQLRNTAGDIANIIGGNAVVDDQGNVTASNIGDTGAANINDAIKTVKTTVKSSDNTIKVTTNTANPNEGTVFDISVDAQKLAESAQLPVVYTDKDGNKVYKVNGKFTKDPTGVDAAQVVPNADVIASMQSADGSTTDPTTLANVQAGKKDTDAVNVSQLKGAVNALGGGAGFDTDGSVKAPTYNLTNPADGSTKTVNNVGDALSNLNDAVNSPLSFGGDTGADVTRKLGQKVSVVGGVTDETKLSSGNIGVVANGNDKLEVKLAKDLTGLSSAKFQDAAGNITTVNGNGVTITPANQADPTKVVSLTKDGLNNGGNVISNVANGAETFAAPQVNGEKIKLANDGKWYKESDVGANGKPTDTATAIDPAKAAEALKATPNGGLVDFEKSNPNNAATVGDLQNLGFNIGASENGYTDQVRNNAKVDFVGDKKFINVEGATKADGTREIKISLKEGDVIKPNEGVATIDGQPTDVVKVGNDYYKKSDIDPTTGKPNAGAQPLTQAQKDTVVNNGDGLVTGHKVAEALQKSGWTVGKADAAEAANVDYNNKSEKVNPDDKVSFADGKNTQVSLGTVKQEDKDGKVVTTTTVKVDVDLPIDFKYTDATGKEFVKANDGKIYAKDQVGADGKPNGNATPLADAEVAKLNKGAQLTNGLGKETPKYEVKDPIAAAAEKAVADTLAANPQATPADILKAVDAAKAAAIKANPNAKDEITKGTGGVNLDNVAWAEKPDQAVNKDQLDQTVNKSGFFVQQNGQSTVAGKPTEKVTPNDVVDFTNGASTLVTAETTRDEKTGVDTTKVSVHVNGLPLTYTTKVNGKDVPVAKVGDKYYQVGADGKPDMTKPADVNALSTNLVNPAAPNGEIGAPSQLGNVANGANTFVAPQVDGKDIKLANDGKWYAADQVDPNGSAKANAKAIDAAKAKDALGTAGNGGLADFANSNPNNVATVGDLQNLGFVIGTADDKYKDQVRNNSRVEFAGDNKNVKVTGSTLADGTRQVKVTVSDNPVFDKVQTNTVQVGGAAGPVISATSTGDLKVAKPDGSAARITNVAPGVNGTDAVNVNQLKQGLGDINNRITKTDKNLRGGIAGSNAAAGLPQVYLPGKSMVAAAAGTYKGESAVAVGYSRASDNGKVILKLQGNANTRGDFGGSVGVGYQW